MKHWFLPDDPDVIGLLRAQAEITRAGIDHFVGWSSGADEGQAVREAEHLADEARRAVQVALRSAFSTPLDPEDVYELSERTDSVINAAKNIVLESEVLALAPDEYMAAMATHLAAGLARLGDAFGALAVDDDAAVEASDAAIATVRDLERTYRVAMSELLTEADLRVVMGRRELYRRYSRAGDEIERVAKRVWYALVKSP